MASASARCSSRHVLARAAAGAGGQITPHPAHHGLLRLQPLTPQQQRRRSFQCVDRRNTSPVACLLRRPVSTGKAAVTAGCVPPPLSRWVQRLATQAIPSTPSPSTSSIDAAEIEKFRRLSAEWWDPFGGFRCVCMCVFGPLCISTCTVSTCPCTTGTTGTTCTVCITFCRCKCGWLRRC